MGHRAWTPDLIVMGVLAEVDPWVAAPDECDRRRYLWRDGHDEQTFWPSIFYTQCSRMLCPRLRGESLPGGPGFRCLVHHTGEENYTHPERLFIWSVMCPHKSWCSHLLYELKCRVPNFPFRSCIIFFPSEGSSLPSENAYLQTPDTW